MASWLALSLLVLLSANFAFPADEDKMTADVLIDNDPYLKNCFVNKATVNMETDGVKEVRSGSECYAKTKIQFKVQDIGTDFYVFQEQGDELAGKATVKYKFGECFQVVIDLEKKDDDTIKYTLRNPDGEDPIKLEKGFMFRIKRRALFDFKGSDYMEVLKEDYTPYISKECKAFERDMGDIKAPTLIDFEQEVEGVPDLILLWKQPPGEEKKYFGSATAKEIKLLETTTSTTTTTAKPTTAGTSSKPVSTSSLVSSTATNTTVIPSPALVVEEEGKFPWWIILVAVVGSLVILLVVFATSYLCWRRRRVSKAPPEDVQTMTTVGSTMETVQETQYGPGMMYFARDAKPTDPSLTPSPATKPSLTPSPAIPGTKK